MQTRHSAGIAIVRKIELVANGLKEDLPFTNFWG